MISNYSTSITAVLLFFLCVFPCHAKKIKVVEKSSDKLVGLSIPQGHARIAFKTNIKDLVIETTVGDPIIRSSTDSYQFYFDVDLTENRNLGLKPRRDIIFRCSNAAENSVTTPELLSGHLYYYYVIIDDFPSKTSFLYSGGTSGIRGIEGAFGARYGGYYRFSFSRKNKGVDIAEWDADVDISNSEFIRYNHWSFIAGSRIGILPDPFPLYVNVGAGYGTYCKQWECPQKTDFGSFYYSDVLKGPEVDLGISFIWDALTLEVGTSFLFGRGGQTNVAFRYGIGLSF